MHLYFLDDYIQQMGYYLVVEPKISCILEPQNNLDVILGFFLLGLVKLLSVFRRQFNPSRPLFET